MHSDENIKTVSTLLDLINTAANDNIIIFAATNKYDLLDEAFKDRFDGKAEFPLFNPSEIKLLLEKLLSSRKKGIELAQNEDDTTKLANTLYGYSNRTIVYIVGEASKLAKRDGRRNISCSDIMNIISEGDFDKVDTKKYHKASKKGVIGFN